MREYLSLLAQEVMDEFYDFYDLYGFYNVYNFDNKTGEFDTSMLYNKSTTASTKGTKGTKGTKEGTTNGANTEAYAKEADAKAVNTSPSSGVDNTRDANDQVEIIVIKKVLLKFQEALSMYRLKRTRV